MGQCHCICWVMWERDWEYWIKSSWNDFSRVLNLGIGTWRDYKSTRMRVKLRGGGQGGSNALYKIDAGINLAKLNKNKIFSKWPRSRILWMIPNSQFLIRREGWHGLLLNLLSHNLSGLFKTLLFPWNILILWE